MTVIVTIHDVMLSLRQKGASDRNFMQALWARFGKIYHQGSINEPDLGGMVEIEFKRCYKLQRATQKTTLGHLRIELVCVERFMNPDPFDILKLKALSEHLPEPLRHLWNRSMTTLEEAMDISEMIVEEAVQAMTIGDAPESARIVMKIPKSPSMMRPKKDKQHMVPVHVSHKKPLQITRPLCTQL